MDVSQTLVTARMIVRVPTPADAPAMLAYRERNRAHLAPSSPAPHPDSGQISHWESLFARAQEDFATGRAARFALFLKADPDAIVGTAALTEVIRGAFQACLLGYGLDRDLEGRGYMREALEAVLAFAFDHWGLHRVMANHLPTNTRSAGLLRRMGFVPEGYARDYLYIDGAWRDHVLTALTNPRPTPPR